MNSVCLLIGIHPLIGMHLMIETMMIEILVVIIEAIMTLLVLTRTNLCTDEEDHDVSIIVPYWVMTKR
jgi:hypothetical protein